MVDSVLYLSRFFPKNPGPIFFSTLIQKGSSAFLEVILAVGARMELSWLNHVSLS